MVTKEELSTASRDFLKAVAQMARAELGSYPTRHQESIWMTRTGPSTMTPKKHLRNTFNRHAVSMIYQERAADPFPEKEHLENLLAQAGVGRQLVEYGYILPLVGRWLDAPDPFVLNEDHLSRVLDEFSDAVLENEVPMRSRDGIDGLNLATDPLLLEQAIQVRRVTEEELWEFGDVDNWVVKSGMFSRPSSLSEDWLVLDMSLPYKKRRGFSPDATYQTRQAVFTALRLLGPGFFQVHDLECEFTYGVEVPRRVRFGEGTPRRYGLAGGAYTLDKSMAERLRQSWPHIRRITESQDHHLRLPATRLVDGGSRLRPEDAIIDYAIGLESLLTAGEDRELRYRFALRGATVLTWEGTPRKTNKAKVFRSLRDFYDIRSQIVHGQRLDRKKLIDMRSFGEHALRDTWWWYFDKQDNGLKATISAIDDRILA